MGSCGSELALRLPKCGILCTTKASIEQHMGLSGFERALLLPKCGLVYTKKPVRKEPPGQNT